MTNVSFTASFCLSMFVFNFSCFALQSVKKVTSDPSPSVKFTVGHKSFESKVRLYNLIHRQSERSFGLRS